MTEKKENQMVLQSGRLKLTVRLRPTFAPAELKDEQTGAVYADGYAFSGKKPVLEGEPELRVKDGAVSAVFRAKAEGLDLTFTYELPKEGDALKERIELANSGKKPLNTRGFACGFRVRADGLPGRFCAVPFRHHTETGELCDYAPEELFTRKNRYSTMRNPIYNRKSTRDWGAEGWAWYGDETALLIAKYNPDDLEWSLLHPYRERGEKRLRFGGAGRWKLDDPASGLTLQPGENVVFGETLYAVTDGGWQEAYHVFQRYTESKGCVLSPSYLPPVNWNELYDNKFWNAAYDDEHTTAKKELLPVYYRREDIEQAAAAAHEMGCQCLYLDPGWDTVFGTTIWDEKRLGTQREFADWLKEKYGLKLALHTPLAPWNDPLEYPPEMRQKDENGKPRRFVCCAADSYVAEKAKRIVRLCKDGACQVMFDGSWYEYPCFDPHHGHSVPSTHMDHIGAIRRITEAVHRECPDVLIEQHDPMTGPGTTRYTPCYLLFGRDGGPDEVWGFELMNEPMEDLMCGRALALYDYNLAYRLPLYLHIDLRKDNENALMLWWYASTCRHLGFGGTSEDPRVRAAQKEAMRVYLAHETFYKQGVFVGAGEMTHIHVLPQEGRFVVDCFSLSDREEKRTVALTAAQLGLSGDTVTVNGQNVPVRDGRFTISAAVPAKGHAFLEGKIS